MQHLDTSPRLISNAGLARVLFAFARHCGMSDFLAQVTSQAFLQGTTIHTAWDGWLKKECAGCSQSPARCTFFNPGATKDATAEKNREARIFIVETNRLPAGCPDKAAVGDVKE